MISLTQILNEVIKLSQLSSTERINLKLMRGNKFTEEDIDDIAELLKQDKLKTYQLNKFSKDIIEKAILKSENPRYAYWYAVSTLKSRWKEAEEFIMKDPVYAYSYALDILKSRWLEAEPYIIKNPGCAYWYTRFVLKSRWREAERYIMEDPYWWSEYRKHFNIK